MFMKLTAPFEFCLQTELSPSDCKQRLSQRLNLKNKALWTDGLEPIWGWVISSQFSIRRSTRPGGMEARGSFIPWNTGTAIRVEMGAMPAMLLLIGTLVTLTGAVSVVTAVRMQSPLGLLTLAAPAILLLIYFSLWRDRSEAEKLLRLLRDILQAQVLSATPNHPCPPLNEETT
jgi:hypothetical protein